MEDDEIQHLIESIKQGDVWWIFQGRVKKCVGVVLEWYEEFNNGELADTPEPAVFFEDGTCAALWISDPNDFHHLQPVFQKGNECSTLTQENSDPALYQCSGI